MEKADDCADPTLVAAEPDLAATRASDLGELFAAIGALPHGCTVERWDVTAALVRQAGNSDVVVGLLAALRRGLVQIARRMEWGDGGPWGSPDEFETDLVSEAWRVICDAAGSTLVYPERTLLNRIYGRVKKQREVAIRRRAHEEITDWNDGVVPTSDGGAGTGARGRALLLGRPRWSVPVAADEPVLDRLTRELVRAARERVDLEDVRVVFLHRVMGYSYVELEEMLGTGRWRLRERGDRDERRLCAA